MQDRPASLVPQDGAQDRRWPHRLPDHPPRTQRGGPLPRNLPLPDGTIEFSGLIPFAATKQTLAVTGGTGAYAGARGSDTNMKGKGDLAPVKVSLLG